ncbi:MAG: TonB-dependent receptor, partial [Blastocatellia bacterium]|nr:TonB-dependent receptor [Blastocatellia bacterium]
IAPRQIAELPINGRNYLDLLQLVPGVALNRQANPNSDQAAPVLGDRGGNTNFLIDGMSNKDGMAGGAAAQFNQDTIAEFQALTTGYKAEFGHASGAIVNVITKSGTNDWHGVGSFFHRNDAFDASNIAGFEAPELKRYDYSLALGGPVVKEKIFFFGSSEWISEKRQLNFAFPPNTPAAVKDNETRFNQLNRTHETRNFLKFDEQFGRHHLTQQMNYTNSHVTDFLPLSQATSLPSTRRNLAGRRLMIGVSDTALLGDQASPWVITLRAQYRGENSDDRQAHPDAGPATVFNLFSGYATGGVFGDLGSVQFGSGVTPSTIRQKYGTADVSAAKFAGRHGFKFGWNYIRTQVDGNEFNQVNNQLFATIDDYVKYGPIYSGFFTLTTVGGLTEDDSRIRLRNHYNGFYAQDDWKLRHNLTLNLGLRYDYDTSFPAATNFSPRIGAAWSVTPKTVIRGSWGMFYDQFRLNLVRDIPPFGGANINIVQPFSYPRLFYGVPTIAPFLVGLCLTTALTDAQVAGQSCPLSPSLPYYGADHLNKIVAPGHAPIPANAVVTASNAQALTGLSPDQFAAQASAAVGRPAGFFFFGPFGALSHAAIPASQQPITLDPNFATPFTRSLNIGAQRELAKDLSVSVDYYHRDLRNVLGVRYTNMTFESRVPGYPQRTFVAPKPGVGIRGFGPWYRGTYDGFSVSLEKRFSRRYLLSASYNYAHAIDNSLDSGLSNTSGNPSDNYVGIVPLVTDSGNGQNNQNGPLKLSNGSAVLVPKAGTFYNGADVDKGPSDLALNHAFVTSGMVELPWKLSVSGIFHAQSGFHFSRQALPGASQDIDGDINFTGIDYATGRNAFTAPNFTNFDMRLTKRFVIRERVKITALFEFFNLFNNRNPAAVAARPDGLADILTGKTIPFGQATQVLPGREGQIGARIEF